MSEPILIPEGATLAVNLAGQAVAAFIPSREAMTLTSIADCQSVTLDKRGQLLLLDALCRAYTFDSPVSSIVTMTDVPQQEDVDA